MENLHWVGRFGIANGGIESFGLEVKFRNWKRTFFCSILPCLIKKRYFRYCKVILKECFYHSMIRIVKNSDHFLKRAEKFKYISSILIIG